MNKPKEKKQTLSWTSIMMNSLDVFTVDGIIVGVGLMYWDGEKLLKPDIIGLLGEQLPSSMYQLRPRGEPVLAVLAKSVQ